jgi:C-terminal processing protease CtpA/Prc
MLDKLPTDGYADVVNYIRISFNFPFYFNNTFGVSNRYNIDYRDSLGVLHNLNVPVFDPLKDTIKAKKVRVLTTGKSVLSKRKRRLLGYRTLEIDSSRLFATMRINTFSKGKLRSFYRTSFRSLRKKHIQQLIVDIRLNGGGRVYASTLLTKYLADDKFKIADSIYANTNTLKPFMKYYKNGFFNELQLRLISKRKSDGRFHQVRYETTTFSPKKRNHFNGKVYVLTSGPTFSASCLFANIVRHQDNITLLGEETGGGWYGNSGIMIPTFKLPHTKVSIRMPLFRVVLSNHISQKGTGILPEILVGPTYDAVIKGYDRKWNAAKSLILKDIEK